MSDSSDEGETWGTPPKLSEAAEKMRGNLLPTKSRKTYESVYNTFVEWKKAKKVHAITENVMLAYFSELADKFKSPTLWSKYSMLRSTININDKINLENFKQLTAFLKKKSSGYEGKKSKVFSASEMKTFLDTAPDNQYLVVKVVLILGISGACRSGELINLTVDDIRVYDDVLVIKLRDTKTKVSRNFTVEGEFMKKILEYQALRPQDFSSNRFFINYRNGCCTRQVIGKNKLSAMPKEIATFLNLPEPHLYTGHSFRRSSATLYADKGADITEIKRLGGWKSTTVAEGYIEDSIGYKRKTGQQISNAIGMTSTSLEELALERPAKRQKIEEKETCGQSTSKTIQEQISPESSNNRKKETVTLNISNCSNTFF